MRTILPNVSFVRFAILLLGTLLIFAVVRGDKTRASAEEAIAAESTTPAGSSSVTPKHDKRTVSVFVYDRDGKLVGPVDSPKLVLTAAQWRKRLTPEQYHVLRASATEAPYCGTLLDNKKDGVYSCAGCGLPLFASSAKFNSGTGWPSFMRPVAMENLDSLPDLSDGTPRLEVKCVRCKGHLGHVFDDGPAPTGLRFCTNSESLQFTDHDKLASLADPAADQIPAKKPRDAGAKSVRPHRSLLATVSDENRDVEAAQGKRAVAAESSDETTTTQEKPAQEKTMTETAVFAGGCFWCTEAAFQQLRGVSDVESGYAGGAPQTATYDQVSTGATGHAEVIRVTYDPAKITYDQLLMVFFDAHDPTQLNRQGNDIGSQYRSAIFYASEAQKEAAEAKIRELTEKKAHGQRRIVTKLEPLKAFFPAEAYHQDYVVNNPFQPYVRGHSIPKACSVQKRHPELMDPEKAGKISSLAQ